MLQQTATACGDKIMLLPPFIAVHDIKIHSEYFKLCFPLYRSLANGLFRSLVRFFVSF